MPAPLLKADQNLDRAVDRCYRAEMSPSGQQRVQYLLSRCDTSLPSTKSATPRALPPPRALTEVAALRLQCFANRLNQCLTNLAATGQPEIPRLVAHTLRLLNLLQDAYTNAPPSALEMWREANSPGLLLYGEPYARYTLQYRDSLSVTGWTTTTITDLQDQQPITPPVSGPRRFYRTMLPIP